MKLKNIANNNPLTSEVDFSFDKLGDKNIIQLIQAFRSNSVCHTLSLGANELSIDSLKLLSSLLETNNTIKILILTGNHLSSIATQEIFKSLLNNNCLEKLALNDNELTDDIIPNIKLLLDKNNRLRYLNISFNKFSVDGIIQLNNIDNTNCSIKINNKINNDKDQQRIMKMRGQYFFRTNTQRNTLDNSKNLLESFKNRISSSFQQQISLWDYVQYCLEHEDLYTQLISELLRSPPSKDRDDILEDIGCSLFVLHPKGSTKDIQAKIYAHLCFTNINKHNNPNEFMILETYRSLVSDMGILNNVTLEEWKKDYNKKFFPINEKPSTKKIDEIIEHTSNMLLCNNNNTSTKSKEMHRSLSYLNFHRKKLKVD